MLPKKNNVFFLNLLLGGSWKRLLQVHIFHFGLHWDLFIPQVSGTKKLVAATAFGAFSLLYLSRHFRRRKGKRRALPPQWEPVGFEFQPLAAPLTGKAHHWFFFWAVASPHSWRSQSNTLQLCCLTHWGPIVKRWDKRVLFKSHFTEWLDCVFLS